MRPCRRCHAMSIEQMESGEMVCGACGLVNEESQFVHSTHSSTYCHEGNPPTLISTPAGLRYRNVDHVSESVKQCLALIKRLSSMSGLSEQKAREIESLFLKIHMENKFKRRHFKGILAGCCVFSVLRSSNVGVLVPEFCRVLGCNAREFNSTYMKLKKMMNPSETPMSLNDRIMYLLKEMPRSTFEERKKQCEMASITKQIVEFIDECWLVTGRSLDASIIACSFFAWKVLDIHFMYHPFEYYFGLMKFTDKKEVAKARVKEINELFLRLTAHLPYVNHEMIDKSNFFVYIEEVLESKELVLDKFSLSQDTEEEDENIRIFKALRRRRRNLNPSSFQETDDSSLFTSDADLIPDSDWALYLKSAEEVEALSRFQSSQGPLFGGSSLMGLF